MTRVRVHYRRMDGNGEISPSGYEVDLDDLRAQVLGVLRGLAATIGGYREAAVEQGQTVTRSPFANLAMIVEAFAKECAPEAPPIPADITIRAGRITATVPEPPPPASGGAETLAAECRAEGSDIAMRCAAELDRLAREDTTNRHLLRENQDLASRLSDAELARDAARAAVERDRSTVTDGLNAIREAMRRREWLRLGRGSYEWDDDRWKDEFGAALDEITAALEPLAKVAGDWSDSPQTRAEIEVARARLASPASSQSDVDPAYAAHERVTADAREAALREALAVAQAVVAAHSGQGDRSSDMAAGAFEVAQDIEALLSAAPREPAESQWKPTHRHYKGAEYQVLYRDVLHTEVSERLVIYRNEDGRIFARPQVMFDEPGRFTPIVPAPEPPR